MKYSTLYLQHMGKYVEKEAMVCVGDEQIDTTIIVPTGRVKAQAVFLHGAGESTKERCLPLAQALGSLGWHSLTFSYPGHGASSGTLLGSTLAGREKLTSELIRKLDFERPELLIGVSMGSYTAVNLLETLANHPSKLVLFVPAAYAHVAEDIPFGPDFSAVLRTPQSYRSARSWEILPKFKGQLAIVQAGQDTVIPNDVYALIREHATNVQSIYHVLIPDAAHQVSIWIAAAKERVQAFAHAIDSFDFTSLSDHATLIEAT